MFGASFGSKFAPPFRSSSDSYPLCRHSDLLLRHCIVIFYHLLSDTTLLSRRSRSINFRKHCGCCKGSWRTGCGGGPDHSLQSGGQLHPQRVSLKLAGTSEVIEVSSQAPVINTESATIGDTKDFQQVSDLPVHYRGATTSSLAMLATVPGAQQDANGNVAVGGGLPSQTQYSVDGASTVNIRQNGALGNMNPSSELISEFKVTQFNNNAECAQLGDVKPRSR
jgi:hypothetical protein